MRTVLFYLVLSFVAFLLPHPVYASVDKLGATPIDLTQHWVGYLCLAIFAAAYVLVILEEQIEMRKSKPVLLAAAGIWALLAIVYAKHDNPLIEAAIMHNFLEYTQLFFFLLVAMTYINSMLERGVFDALRKWLLERGYSYRQLFWVTGLLAFFLSPIADNLTTALIMCAVVLAVANDEPKFVSLSCINIVVAANAGGVFSPFGDITTLMVWQSGVVDFWEFLDLFAPSVVNFMVPALIMQFAIPDVQPPRTEAMPDKLKPGGLAIVFLFIATIITAVCCHHFLHIPPVFGMMAGLAYLKIYGYRLQRQSHHWHRSAENPPTMAKDPYAFDVFAKIAHAEWDTLFFFYGVIMAVGGLGFIGYLEITSAFFYGEMGPTVANIIVGMLSAIVDNIPVMFAVLTMSPDMPHEQWLLVTLTAGVGGSLLSVGSAAGVALMGQARGQYTFFAHLKWAPVIALGYFSSILTHVYLNFP